MAERIRKPGRPQVAEWGARGVGKAEVPALSTALNALKEFGRLGPRELFPG
jgi:hypothetical protein